MSRPEQRSDKAHLAVVRLRSPKSHLRSIRSWLGRQASIGGRPYAERIVKSDEFAARFMNGLDSETRMKALATVAAVLAKAPAKPVPLVPSPNSRVKIRWSDEFIARFRIQAPHHRSDGELAAALGLPPYCAEALRRARRRFGGMYVGATSQRCPGATASAVLPLAA
jgi:hypothetical protein